MQIETPTKPAPKRKSATIARVVAFLKLHYAQPGWMIRVTHIPNSKDYRVNAWGRPAGRPADNAVVKSWYVTVSCSGDDIVIVDEK